MKLIWKTYSESFEITRNALNQIIIENNLAYWDFLTSISSIKDNDEIVFFDTDNSNMQLREFDFILSPLDFDRNKKEYQKQLIEIVNSDASISENGDRLQQSYRQTMRYLEEIISLSEFDISYNEDWDVTDFFKALDLQLNYDGKSFAENLMTYIYNYHRLLGKEIFIIVNCNAFFPENEMRLLSETSENDKVTIVLIDSHIKNAEVNGAISILDVDLCRI